MRLGNTGQGFGSKMVPSPGLPGRARDAGRFERTSENA